MVKKLILSFDGLPFGKISIYPLATLPNQPDLLIQD